MFLLTYPMMIIIHSISPVTDQMSTNIWAGLNGGGRLHGSDSSIFTHFLKKKKNIVFRTKLRTDRQKPGEWIGKKNIIQNTSPIRAYSRINCTEPDKLYEKLKLCSVNFIFGNFGLEQPRWSCCFFIVIRRFPGRLHVAGLACLGALPGRVVYQTTGTRNLFLLESR